MGIPTWPAPQLRTTVFQGEDGAHHGGTVVCNYKSTHSPHFYGTMSVQAVCAFICEIPLVRQQVSVGFLIQQVTDGPCVWIQLPGYKLASIDVAYFISCAPITAFTQWCFASLVTVPMAKPSSPGKSQKVKVVSTFLSSHYTMGPELLAKRCFLQSWQWEREPSTATVPRVSACSVSE